jgi:hypothetical protein
MDVSSNGVRIQRYDFRSNLYSFVIQSNYARERASMKTVAAIITIFAIILALDQRFDFTGRVLYHNIWFEAFEWGFAGILVIWTLLVYRSEVSSNMPKEPEK